LKKGERVFIKYVSQMTDIWIIQGSNIFAFSALTLLVGRQDEHLACRKLSDEVLCWRGYLPRTRCKWFAYGPADASATSLSHASLKSRLV